MQISLFSNIKNTRADIFDGDIGSIAKGLLNPVMGCQEKKQLPLWSPTIFQGTRNGANSQYVTCLVFDLDDGVTPFDTWRLFTRWKVLAYTSFSHKPHWNKYRIILPLAKPVPALEWKRASKWAKNLWNDIVGRGWMDEPALNDVARAYYRFAIPGLPGKNQALAPEEYHKRAYWDNGSLLELDWESIPKEDPKKKQAEYSPKNHITLDAVQLDSRFRERFASQVGATMIGNTARYIRCPQCGDASVFYSIDLGMPNAMKYPQCNHKNSCGWWGSLKDLL